MTTFLPAVCDFVVDNWLAVTMGAALVGAWIWVCHELCVAAEPEMDGNESKSGLPMSVRSGRSRSALSSQSVMRHADNHGAFRTRRS